jgi:hypothetical protein
MKPALRCSARAGADAAVVPVSGLTRRWPPGSCCLRQVGQHGPPGPAASRRLGGVHWLDLSMVRAGARDRPGAGQDAVGPEAGEGDRRIGLFIQVQREAVLWRGLRGGGRPMPFRERAGIRLARVIGGNLLVGRQAGNVRGLYRGAVSRCRRLSRRPGGQHPAPLPSGQVLTWVPDGLALGFRAGITLRRVRPARDRRASPPFCAGAVLRCDLAEARRSLWPRLAACGLWVAGFCGGGWVVLVGWAARRGGRDCPQGGCGGVSGWRLSLWRVVSAVLGSRVLDVRGELGPCSGAYLDRRPVRVLGVPGGDQVVGGCGFDAVLVGAAVGGFTPVRQCHATYSDE